MLKPVARGLALLAATCLSTVALAQSISVQDSRRIVEETSALIRRHYVDAKQRDATAEMLAKNLAAGRYDKKDVRELSSVVTDDLRGFTKDSHMSLAWNPGTHEMEKKRAAAGPSDPQVYLAEARPLNHGLVETRILPGNVRYLKITGFYWIPDVTGAVYDSAMRFLREGSAAIIDLRHNGGGGTGAVKYAISHFMPAGSEELMITFTDPSGRPDQTRALSYLPAGRVTVPLFVLTDGESVSAAEEFIYHVRHFKLGTLVGSRTKGAANNNLLYPVGTGFIASISVDRPVHAVTGSNWEGTGIEPHIAAPPGRELRVAHVTALERVAASSAGPARNAARWALPRARAELAQPKLTPAALASYAGQFQDRVLRVDGDRLVYLRPGHPPAPLIFLGEDTFGLPDTDSLRLRLAGDRRTLEVLYDDGSRVPFKRSG